jgi:uncharacterized membrane protein YdjX (TVP38/TMEM64 family)
MKLSKLIIIIGMVCVGLSLKYFNCSQFLSITWLHEHIAQLKELVAHNYWYAAGIYCLSYIAVCLFALPGTTACMVAGGMLFGIIPGIILINISATLGATLLFLISRFVIGDAVQQRYSLKLETFNEELNRYGYFYLLTLRVIGLLPFGFLNILAGVTQVSTRTFMWTTSLGIIPLSLLSAYTGNELSNALVLQDMWTYPVICATALFVALRVGLVPVVIQTIRKRRFA